MKNEQHNFGKCKYCTKSAITALNAGAIPVCSHHFIKGQDEGCLTSMLLEQIDQNNKIIEDKDVQMEIKIHFPNLYSKLEGFF